MRYVIIHGHFYQPPRENPWTERVDREPSAKPFHDWNARIQRQCYGPNRAARILDGEGRIGSIVSNYQSISFDFGPTLLDWMIRAAPETSKALVEADRRSRERLGHGNALAQGYNHSILPLLDRRDKVTQVRWGKAHFRRFYGREPEGMWLPETAADLETLDVLAEEGIRFTVLAPWQLTGVRSPGETAWREQIGGEDLGRAYRCRTGPNRELALFFYDGDVAREVAFEGLLDSGDRFAGRLEQAARSRPEEAPLVHVATDGETYGHHHRFGEMALAYALEQLDGGNGITVTNYATFLAQFPPILEARIREPGSWSCVHGVERWRSDCGCHTGGEPGWNQKWRDPLFRSFQYLRGELAAVFERRGAEVLRDPWAARDAYIDVLLDPSKQTKASFLDVQAKPGADSAEIWRLLEMERHALLMFTSCGWFFNDLAGIETLQVLRYAGRALELCGRDAVADLEERFLGILSEAHSNRPPHPDGAEIFRDVVQRARVGPERIVAEEVLSRRLGLDEKRTPRPPAFSVRLWPDRDAGRAEVVHQRTDERVEYRYRVEMDDSPRLAVFLDRQTPPAAWRRPMWGEDPATGTRQARDPAPGRQELGPEDLDPEAAEQLTDRFLERLERETVSRLEDLVGTGTPALRFLEERGIRPPWALGRVLEAVWLQELLQEMGDAPGADDERVDTWGSRMRRFQTLQLSRDDLLLAEVLTRRLRLEAERVCRERRERPARTLLKLLDVAEEMNPRPDLWETQTALYGCALGGKPRGVAVASAEFLPPALWRELLERLGFSRDLVAMHGEESDRG